MYVKATEPEDAGEYRLTIRDYCSPGQPNNYISFISDPIYILIKGYDLQGQPVEYDQIVVQFENKEETKQFENKILTPNAGWVKKACNCNRELYLWQFPSTENATAALLEIDRKKKRIKSKNKPKGGFNNSINIGEKNNAPIAYNLLSDAFATSYPDSVTVFMLDSGLYGDQDKFLTNESPVDSCYNIVKSKGYSYVDSVATISTNYADELWHGTFGYHSLTEHVEDESVLKIVPLKIFDENGKGNLFDMVCAMYHAIDHNADIINVSAGYYGEPSEIMESAISYAKEKGVFIVAAAGNDTINIDSIPQYPAHYASKLDSVKNDHVILVASINAQNQLSQFSNHGKQAVTLACYGENIHSYGLRESDVVASGTSMATFLTTKALALEIAKDKQRSYQQIWSDFESNWLVNNPSLVNFTQTGKHIDFTLEEANIKGCTDPNGVNHFLFANEEDGTCITDFEMYPNPSNGIVQLAFSENSNFPIRILLTDCLGKTVLSINSSDNIVQMNLDVYPKGIYFIRVENGDEINVQKLILN